MKRNHFHAAKSAHRHSARGMPNAPASAVKPLATAVTLALVAFSQPTLAANCTWNPVTGNWATASDWSCAAVPGGADSATVGAAKTVTINAGQTILNLTNAGSVNIDAFLLTLNGGGSTTNTGTLNVGAGPIPNNAALNIGGGHNIDNTGGIINVSADSVINQFGSTITGGTINTTGTGKLTAFASGANFLDGVTLNGTLDMATGYGIERVTNGLVLNGTVNIGQASILAPQGNQTISGSGSIVFADNNASNRLNTEVGNLILGSGITVRGNTGYIGQQAFAGGAATLTNQGTIAADVAGGTITLNVNNGVTNTGTLRADNGGTLILNQNGSGIANAGGTIRADNTGAVLFNGVGISGGVVGTSGTGAIKATNNSANLLSGVTFNGLMDLASQASQLRVANGLVLNGTLDIGGSSALYLDNRSTANQSITTTGGGVIRLAGGALRMEGTGQTTTGANVAIRGHGTVGQATLQSGQYTWINDGLVSADVSGQTLNLVNPGNGSQPIQNNGILEATGGGRLLLSADVAAAVGSQIRADAGSVIEMNGVRVTGTVNTTGNGSFRATNNSANVLSGVTFNGLMDLAGQASQLRVADSLVLNGTLDVGGSILYVDNRTTANQSISTTGSGVIQLAGGALRMEGTGQTTTGAGVTIRGHGTVGQATLLSGQYTWINNGLVSADASGQTLNLVNPGNGSQPIQNNGILEATGGGRLLLSADVAAGVGSQIRADAGSVIEMNGVRVSGTVNTTGNGSFRASNTTSNVLSGVTLNGQMDLASQASQLRVADSLVLNGGIDVGGSILYVDNRTTASQSLTTTGAGVIQLAGGALRFEGAGQTTLGSGVTVRGHGTVGQATLQSGAHQFINDGTLRADVSGQTLNVVPIANGNLAIQHNGTMQAANGGTLQVSADVIGGAASRYDVDAASRIVMNGVTFSGVVNQTGAGAIETTNTSSNLLSAASLTGRISVGAAGGSQLRIADGLAMNGGATITVGGAGAGVLYFDNRPTAHQTVSGNGQIVLNGGALRMEGGSSTTWDSGITVRGNGTIGQAVIASANQTLFNNGTIIADGGALTIQPIANVGALQGTGTLRVDGGALTLSTGKPTLQGTLDIRGAGSLALGTQNLVLSSDYTNAQALSGNAFDRRAGVSGTGQILAGGDVQQVITGNGVAGGNTANATLTIGNVRVGANTYNVQIANQGSTGPALRGAIQTSVNGGNITDARLGGAGVTAGNYNAGGPGGSTGDLPIVFNVASAGALAPLTGQAINLRSTYDNIADQKLNIVLAGGAAAYNAAVGSAGSPVNIANQRVNGTSSAAVGIANTAASGAYSEDLNASVGSVSGPVVGSGSVAGRLAGTNNTGTGSINVGVATGSAGFKTGTVTIDYQTAGAVNGVSNGLGVASAGSQTVTVSGNVYQAAAGQLQGNTLNFGTLQVGQQVNQNLVVRNTATGPAGFVEDLNASFGASGNSQISGSGSLTGILAGQNSTGANGTMTVTVTGATAGALNSGIAVNYFSAGAVNGVGNGLGVLGVGSEQFNVNGTIQAVGNVINQASPQINTPTVTLAARRVGDAAATANVSISNVATVAPQAALNASIATNGAPVTASGSFNLLTPGATDSSSLVVGIGTATAGNFTGGNAGSATISLVSDASNVGGCAPNCQLNLAPQTVTVEGKVYTAAQGTVQGTVNFGIVHVGDVVAAQGVAVQNAAPATALNDTLRASIGGTGGAFTDNGGMVGGLAAGGAANSSALAVGLDTTTAGIYSGNAIVSLASQNPDMADLDLGTANVSLSGQVNKYANAVFDKVSGAGTLSRSGNLFTLDFGNVLLGGALSAILDVDNAVGGGPSDLLDGVLGMNDVSDFTTLLLSSFQNIGADGSSGNALSFLFDTNSLGLGTFQDSIDLGWFGHNASGYVDPTRHYTLLVRGNVYESGGTVPEPSAALLVLTALAGLALRRRRTGRAC